MPPARAAIGMGDELHPDAEQFLELAKQGPDLHTLSPPEARAFQREMSLPSGEPEAVGAVHDTVVRGDGHGIPLRVYVPEGEGPFPTLVWAHGGGFVIGDVDTEDPVGRALANAAGCVVVSVDYRLAPEHPFPAALHDVYDATAWAAESVDRFGGDPDRLAVGGASAGGNLATGVARLARDRDGPAIDYQVLVYPVTSYTEEFPSRAEYDGYFLTREAMDWFDECYFSDPLHGHNPYAYPLEASDHADLPPATVVTAGFDPLWDEGEAYADAMAEAGVPVEHRHYDDVIHAFFGRLQEPNWERARVAVADVADDLRANLA